MPFGHLDSNIDNNNNNNLSRAPLGHPLVIEAKFVNDVSTVLNLLTTGLVFEAEYDEEEAEEEKSEPEEEGKEKAKEEGKEEA